MLFDAALGWRIVAVAATGTVAVAALTVGAVRLVRRRTAGVDDAARDSSSESV
jgi:hypothetical protein